MHCMDRYRALLEAELLAFLTACTTPDREARVSASDLYTAYLAWSRAGTSPVPPMTETMFGRVAPNHLFRRRVRTGQTYVGIRLI